MTTGIQVARKAAIQAKAADGALSSGVTSTLATATFQCLLKSVPIYQKLRIKLNLSTTHTLHAVARTNGLPHNTKQPVSTRSPQVIVASWTSVHGQVASAWGRKSLDSALRNSMASPGAWETAAASVSTNAMVK